MAPAGPSYPAPPIIRNCRRSGAGVEQSMERAEASRPGAGRPAIMALMVAVLVFCLLYLRRQKPADPRALQPQGTPPAPLAAGANDPVSARSPPVGAASADPAERSRRAFEKLRSAYADLVNAKSYRIVTTARQPSGSWATFTYLRQRTGADGNLLRMDTVNYDASGKVMPHLSRSFITNQDGDWELSDFEGSEEVAFHVTGPTSDSTPAEMQHAFVAQSQAAMDPGSTYSESAGTYGSQAVEIVTVSSQRGDVERFAIGSSTGSLMYWSMGETAYETTVETNVDLAPGEFAIPSGKIVTQSQDPNRDRGYLFDPPAAAPTPDGTPSR
jgi:hypothetical protein